MRNNILVKILSFALLATLALGMFTNCGGSGKEDSDGAGDVS